MLPFVTPPAAVKVRRIGNARCGIVEVEERGGLTVAEDDAIAELLAEGESAFVEAAKAADAIAAAEEGVSIVEAFEIIRKAISGGTLEAEADAIRLRHAETIQAVATVFARTGQRNMEASVTAIVRSRLGLPDWTLEDTRKMDRALFRGLNQLVQDEQAAEGQVEEPVTEEEVGKPPEANGSGRKRGGRRSSGNSAEASPDSSPALPLAVS